MRTLRRLLGGMIIVALLGGGGSVAVAAQPEASAEPTASMSCEELEAAAAVDEVDASALDPAVELARRCMSCDELDAARGSSADAPLAVSIAASVVYGERCEDEPAQSVEERRGTFTFEVVDESVEDQYDVDEAGVPTVTVLRTMTVEASDPRLSGTWTEDWTCQYGGGDFPGFDVCVGGVRVENQGGSWLGSADGIHLPRGRADWAVLEGQGGYSGLTAIRHTSVGFREDTREGVVLDFEMPVRPADPVEVPE